MLLLTGIWIYSSDITTITGTGNNSPVQQPRSNTPPKPSPKRRKIQSKSPNNTMQESLSVSRRIDLSQSGVSQSPIITRSLSEISTESLLMRDSKSCTDPSGVHQDDQREAPVGPSQNDQANTPTGSADARPGSVVEPRPSIEPRRTKLPPKRPPRKNLAHMEIYNFWSNKKSPKNFSERCQQRK